MQTINSLQSVHSFSFQELCLPQAALKELSESEELSDFYISARNFVTQRAGNLTDTYEIGEKLVKVVQLTMKEMGWKSPVEGTSSKTPPELFTEIPELPKCQTYLHNTRSCTSCAKFVCPKVRTRFL